MGQYLLADSKKPTYPVIYRFPLVIALCDHNPTTLTDRLSITATYYDALKIFFAG